MTVAIIGSRTFSDYDLLEKTIKNNFNVTPIEKIVSGGAIGADSLAEDYAKSLSIPIEIIHPDWVRYGRSAGYIRNTQIIKKADFVFVFWDGHSLGTQHSINLCRMLDKSCLITIF